MEFLGRASLAGDARDLSGLSALLEDGTPADVLGGFGSAIDWTGHQGLYVAAVDRGPHDGATDFPDRLQLFDLELDPLVPGGLSVRLLATTLLVDEQGRTLTGRSTAFDEAAPEHGLRFDPEGVRVGRGRYYVSDEYGPWVVEFDRKGRLLRRLPVPEKFRVKHLGAAREEAIEGNTTGRVTNHGFEGLALSPDCTTLFALLQHPLIQDGGRKGVHVRLLEIPVSGGSTHEYVVDLEDPDFVFNEIEAIEPRRFLAIERDHERGSKARVKRIVEIDLDGASDVSSVPSLAAKALPDGLRPASKRICFDLLDPRFGLAGASFPEKVEGLCLGPALPDGRRVLVVTSDNDVRLDEASWFWMFSVRVE